MNNPFEQVREFHQAFGIPANTELTEVSDDQLELRKVLEQEEHDELMEALDSRDLVKIAHELADKVVVACGTAHVFGIPLFEVVTEIMESNMSKLDPETGKPVLRADGKIQKGPHYQYPNVARVLGLQ